MKHLKNSSLLQKFAQKINDPSNIKIILPESNDRVSQASEILSDLGINVSQKQDIENYNIESLAILKKLKFAKNWPQEDLLKDPLIMVEQQVLERQGLTASRIAQGDHSEGDLRHMLVLRLLRMELPHSLKRSNS